jgi:hypothetical protein
VLVDSFELFFVSDCFVDEAGRKSRRTSFSRAHAAKCTVVVPKNLLFDVLSEAMQAKEVFCVIAVAYVVKSNFIIVATQASVQRRGSRAWKVLLRTGTFTYGFRHDSCISMVFLGLQFCNKLKFVR